jgi:poly(A) polymerase
MPALDRASIDPDADRVVRKLARAGYKAYLVGGCVRDLLVGKKPKDFDVATSATPNEIRATFRNCRIIGRRFRLAHIVFGSKIIETATFRANPRDEDAEHDLLIRRDNVFGSETEDARRRDFTINGLFYDVEKEEVIDHVVGLPDLDAKLVRTIGDPEIRFQEDPVRMLRAIKFAARLDFGFEEETYRALLRWRGEISKCAPPRLLEEVHRLLRGGASRRSFELMVETGVLAVLSPYLAGLLEGDGAPVTEPPLPGQAPRSTVARVEYDEEDPAEHDPDDPEEPAAEADGVDDDAADGDDDDEAADAEIELDDEERAWHAVWADQAPHRVTGRPPGPGTGRDGARPTAPAGRPLPTAAMVATPVRLSFLTDPAELRRRRGLVWAAFRQLDAAIAEGKDPSNAVAFALLLAPLLPDEARPAEVHGAVAELAGPLISQLHVTRRDSERLRYLLLAYRRLVAARKKGGQAELGGGREVIDEAVLLYELLERAAGRGQAPTPGVIAAPGGIGAGAGRDGGDEDSDEDGKKRRRRRRGGRRS